MKLFILSIAAAGLLLGSCSSPEPVSMKKGAEFTFGDQKMTVDFKANSVLVNAEEEQALIAPEGKMYVLVDVTAKEDNYFLIVKDGEKELEAVDFLISKPFTTKQELTSPNKSELYLVDAKSDLTIEIKGFGDDLASLKTGTLKDESTIKVNPKMTAFVNEFTEGGRIVEAAKKYVKAGVNAADITTENGEPMFGDPITKGLTISNISADGNTYTCKVTGFGMFEKVQVTWEGDYISKITIE